MRRPFSHRVRWFLRYGAWPQPLTYESVDAVMTAIADATGATLVRGNGPLWTDDYLPGRR